MVKQENVIIYYLANRSDGKIIHISSSHFQYIIEYCTYVLTNNADMKRHFIIKNKKKIQINEYFCR